MERCDGCASVLFELTAVAGANLCEGCAEKSARIDKRLADTHEDDPVYCDSCGDRVAFDARLAVVARECGGGVLCASCKVIKIKRGAA